MLHFIIDCLETIIEFVQSKRLMQNVYNSAESTALFNQGDIKVRINTYKHYNIGNTTNNFIHIFGYIMERSNDSQNSLISKRIITNLKKLFPDIPVLSINIKEFEKATYCNKSMV